jgi:hypothetical protein
MNDLQNINKYKISYLYGDMGGGGTDRGPELEIYADNEIQAAFFYFIRIGFYNQISYKDFLKLNYSTQTWGLTIKLLTDIPNIATFSINNRNLKGIYCFRKSR